VVEHFRPFCVFPLIAPFGFFTPLPIKIAQKGSILWEPLEFKTGDVVLRKKVWERIQKDPF